MCLNETYNTVRVGKHLSDTFPITKGLKKEDDQLCFRICHLEGSGKAGGLEIEWYTSASGLC
jgi:hypothetical protein